jgi:hypothetical protein
MHVRSSHVQHGKQVSQAVLFVRRSGGETVSFNIVLKHVGGERKTLPVEYVAPTLSYLSIRWGQSGVYDLNLATNVLRARSAKAQRKGKPHWTAEDIDAVRKMARNYLDEKRGNPHSEAKAAYKRHVENMPNPRIGHRAPVVDALAEAMEHYEPFPQYTGDPDID